MKICVLGDTHLGCRNDLQLFHDHFEKFYKWLFDKLEQEGVTDIIQLGDLWDRRKYINFNTLSRARHYFFDELKRRNITMNTIVGNHDIYWRESVDINSSDLLLKDYSNVHVNQCPVTVNFDGTLVDIIPWICTDNEAEVKQFIASSKSDICAGHFEIASFSMYRGIESHDGLPVDMFSKYEQVWSGHYHTRSRKDNIIYCGTPYEMTWQDYNDPKGFHIFDTDTRELVFWQSPFTYFVRLEYNDTQELFDLNCVDLKDCFVKLIVTHKTDLYKFDNFINQLYNKSCYEVKIIEDLSQFEDGEIGEEVNLEDTIDVLSEYIDSIDTDADKEKIKTFMKTLYIEASNVEVV